MKGITVKQIQNAKPEAVHGEFTDFMGERFYRISNYDAMPPFFMTIVSSSDVWNYLWSNGGITAGRINSDKALFPYYTADKVSDSRTYTGPYTALKVRSGDDEWLWEPFSEAAAGLWKIKRAIYKNMNGSKVYFEEVNEDLGLAFIYGWTSSDAFGLVRRARIENRSAATVKLEILDGARNILPACVTSAFQNDNSVLLDAYKMTDLDKDSGTAVFSVTSIVTDKAEPSEGLFANVAWFTCPGELFLSPDAPEAFRSGTPISRETVLKGTRAAFWVKRELSLEPAGASPAGANSSGAKSADDWYLALDTSLDLARLKRLEKRIADRKAARAELEADIEAGSRLLDSYIAAADGMQTTADLATCAHHEANVMFNVMRGGIPADGYTVRIDDLLAFTATRNHALVAKMKDAVAPLGEKTSVESLRSACERTGDAQLARMCSEYLPLTFSRRHGDPSRPWNRFSIELKDAHGNSKLNYQGNWRDIFQNWEALALSYPGWIDSFTAKFLNATTADGFNPYRITRDGIDWEVQEPDNPWSNIGYWGDHQVIYLEKLLELRSRFDRDSLVADLGRACFSSANVPYRLKPYADIVKNPRSTIRFDEPLHEAIEKAAHEYGTDAKLIRAKSGEVALVSMTAKLIPIVLAKMSNLVPGGGIWLNTQRPEWNDANNALAGYGLSMVTTYYLRRFMTFLRGLYADAGDAAYAVPRETADFFAELSSLFAENSPEALGTGKARRAFMDKAGASFERQRESIYANGFATETKSLSSREIIKGLDAFLAHVEATIRANRRSDGLYHAYNTMEITASGDMEVHYLQEMLEGQVAILSSGALTGKETADLCDALKASKLFRADQYSYILYPDKELPLFRDKNIVPSADAKRIPLLAAMLKNGDGSVIREDDDGVCHFNPAFRNAHGLEGALDAASAPDADRRAILELYEKTFNHRSFTGRSGTFYAYEGLGSIYWHMVAKLMLAVQEKCLEETDAKTKERLAAIYYDVRKGIGFNKTPDVYGAFPTDPYSHTPAGQGAKQPGMTGQVKEEVITRWGELGLSVNDGILTIDPAILRKCEFLEDGSLSFTWCGTPFTYRLAAKGESPSITVTAGKGTSTRAGSSLSRDESRALFARSGEIKKIEALVNAGSSL